MWETSQELNKVVLSFLRQILGVHKKTTNIGLLAETGKYPLSVQVFSRIIKYYMRISVCPKTLIKQAYAVNCRNFNEGRRNWTRITHFVTKSINFDKTITSPKEIDNKMKICKNLLQKNFQHWWKSHAVVTGVNKLDFYHKYRKQFCFDEANSSLLFCSSISSFKTPLHFFAPSKKYCFRAPAIVHYY